MSGTTGPPPTEEVEPFSTELGPTECIRRKKQAFTLQTFTEISSLTTVYMIIELMELRKDAKLQGSSFDTSQMLTVTLVMFITSLMFILYCFSDDQGVKPSVDKTCNRQLIGLRVYFAANLVLSGGLLAAAAMSTEPRYRYGFIFGGIVLYGAIKAGHYFASSK